MRFFVAKVNLERAGQARLQLPAAAAGRLRVAEVHAADPPRHGERRRPAGAVRLRADPQGPRRDHQLPHRAAALGRRDPDLREGRVRPTSTGDVPTAGAEAEHATVFLEYAWDMGWCDPCAADPLSTDELRKLGVFWLDGDGGSGAGADAAGRARRPRGGAATSSSPACTCATTARTSPRTWCSRRPATARTSRAATSCATPGPATTTCSEADAYRRELRDAARAARPRPWPRLTGWDINEIRRKQGPGPRAAVDDRAWWQRLWQ